MPRRLARGYAHFDRELTVAGFIVNRVGSPRHGQGVAEAIERATGKPVFGWLPRDARLTLAERHLGLVPTRRARRVADVPRAAGDVIREHLDLDRLLALPGRFAELPMQSGLRIKPTVNRADRRPIDRRGSRRGVSVHV